MSVVKPFRGVRPRPDLVEKVAAVPYDVVNFEEACEIARPNPYCFLRIEKSEIDLEPGLHVHDMRIFEKAQENLEKFIKEGTMIRDPKKCYYIYRQIMKIGDKDHSQVGLLAGASVEEYEKDLIKKHEHTRKDKEEERTLHVDTANANTGPVFLAYKQKKSIDAIVDEIIKHKPEYDFTAGDGIKHTLWVVSEDERINKIAEEFKKVDCLYVADGHHRSAAGTRVAQKRREENPHHTGEEEYNFFLSVIFPSNQLYIMDYNRVVKTLGGNTAEEFLNKISKKFTVEKKGKDHFKPGEVHTFGMYLDGLWYKLTAKEGTYPGNDPVNSLDVAILQANLLDPILGIKNPREDKNIDFIGGMRGLKELVRLVDSGKFKVAFAMFPTTMEQLMKVADQGKVMPPKSTWFEPKLRSGMVVHLLED
ncbi:MAG TPA: DUF1015 family protein [Candidatus Eremiobacteraeota bacterium]|nr:MAG: hypothetical protein BWY64_01602 [bacterium ADurb.Bin363]HPZ09935.1 DUF1015 family protein [Candidatus Eremiobacteraeota bacterium]